MLPLQNTSAPLERYGHNLTRLAERGTFTPLVDHDGPVERMLQILQRKNKYNPVLLDGDETRRWQIVAEVVRRMAAGEAPEPLLNRQVIALDYELLLADLPDGGRDVVEVRLGSIFTALHQSARSLILFVDHFHRLVGEESDIDASNLLAPLLMRREIQLIGTCTIEQYRQDIERNAPIHRCCQYLFSSAAEQERFFFGG